MTVVDFFIWPFCEKNLHDLAICNLIYSIYRSKKTISLLIDKKEECVHFDDLLWTFEETSFLPHGFDDDSPVKLATDFNDCTNNVLVNLGQSPHPHPKIFGRIIETAGYNESTRLYARNKFKNYKDHEIKVSSHQLESSNATKNIIV